MQRRSTLCWWVYDQLTGIEEEAHVDLPEYYYSLLQADLKTYISQAELIAGIMPFWSRPDLFAGRRVIHFMDNTAALSALANGYSRKPDLARLVNLYHVAVVALGCEWWGEWVPSAANLADIPTREKSAGRRPAHVRDGGAVELPPLHWGAGQLREWMARMEERHLEAVQRGRGAA